MDFKCVSSEEVLEFVAQTGGIFKGEIINKIFSRQAFLKFLKYRNELEYVIKNLDGYIYKIPDKYIRKYHNVRWKKAKSMNSTGEREFRKRVVEELRKQGLKGKYQMYSGERFYRIIYEEMLKPENENIYWTWIFDGLNEHHIIYSFAMQLLYLSDHIIPYTKDGLTPNFPPHYWKYSGKGMYFSITDDDLGYEKKCCVIIESLKSYESIFKTIETFGVEPVLKDRCIFYIISGNRNSLKTLMDRIKKYRKHIKDSNGNLVRIEDSFFRYVKIFYRYYPYLDKYINRR